MKRKKTASPFAPVRSTFNKIFKKIKVLIGNDATSQTWGKVLLDLLLLSKSRCKPEEPFPYKKIVQFIIKYYGKILRTLPNANKLRLISATINLNRPKLFCLLKQELKISIQDMPEELILKTLALTLTGRLTPVFRSLLIAHPAIRVLGQEFAPLPTKQEVSPLAEVSPPKTVNKEVQTDESALQ